MEEDNDTIDILVVELGELDVETLIQDLERRLGKVDPHRFKLIHFPGGDWPLRKPLLQLISKAPGTKFVEVFGGSCLMSMFVPREKFKLIVCNDIDNLLVDLYKALKHNPKELQKRLAIMPASRTLLKELAQEVKTTGLKDLDPIERAAVVLYLSHLSFNSKLSTGSFSVSVNRNDIMTFRRRVVSILEYAKLWADIIIENLDFRRVIRNYDRPNTVFYCDPPFISVKGKNRDSYYRFLFKHEDLKDLLGLLEGVKGYFVLKLESDNFEFDYVQEWVRRNSFKVTPVTSKLRMAKAIGVSRSFHTTYFIHNYVA